MDDARSGIYRKHVTVEDASRYVIFISDKRGGHARDAPEILICETAGNSDAVNCANERRAVKCRFIFSSCKIYCYSFINALFTGSSADCHG